jgi:hypothetical protein
MLPTQVPVDRSPQEYEMLRVDDARPSLDLSIRSWEDLSRISTAMQKDRAPGDDPVRNSATDRSSGMLCATGSNNTLHTAADSLLRPEKSMVNSTGSYARQKPMHAAWTSIQQWRLEWMLMIIAISILIAIVVVLREFNNIPQPDWKFGLNLSTLIAILATLLRSSLISVVEEGMLTRLSSLHFSRA